MSEALNEFNKWLDELVQAPIYLTESIHEIDKEIYENCCLIGIDEELENELTVNDLLSFLMRIKESRAEALKKSDLNIDLIFYLWHDEQAMQLRFNFINSNHSKLPFTAEYTLVENAEDIIKDFLTPTDEPLKLDVFQQIISKN